MQPLIALHGFLGQPSDFDCLALKRLVAPAIFRMAPGPLPRWIERFERDCPNGSMLMGYSMGGRLALHALLANPSKFSAAIIMAAHPGLATERERIERRAHDGRWAKRFCHEPWQQLMTSWNSQAVLASSKPRIPDENLFSRTDLARCLRYFSLGEQGLLTGKINQLSVPILWLAAKSEARVVENIKLTHPRSKLILLENSSHRFLFEQTDLVQNYITDFLAQ